MDLLSSVIDRSTEKGIHGQNALSFNSPGIILFFIQEIVMHVLVY